MKRIFSSKEKRKQAESDIINGMKSIQLNLDAQKEKTDKERVMSVLKKFLKLKSNDKMH